jgi:hypothetical protein
LTKDELVRQGKTNALRYIEWGEKQVFTSGTQAGLTWPHGAEVRERNPGWYSLPAYRGKPANLFFAIAYSDRHIHKYSPEPLLGNNRLYFLSPAKGIDDELVAAVMNSSLTAFFTEATGRVTMGDGALELTVEDARDYLYVPDVRNFDEADRETIRMAFQPLLKRPIGSVLDEIQKPDRQALDRAVLSAIGMDSDEWLPRLYDGLSILVRERIELGKKRSQSKSSHSKKAAGRVSEEVLHDLLPNGPQHFPEDFLTPAARVKMREIPLPEKPLQHISTYFGKEIIGDRNGIEIELNNMFEVRYVLYAQANGERIVHIPEKMLEITRAVNEYTKYLRDLRQRLYEAYFRRSIDQAAANHFVEDTWRKLKLHSIQE